jgi:hypothetical protein
MVRRASVPQASSPTCSRSGGAHRDMQGQRILPSETICFRLPCRAQSASQSSRRAASKSRFLVSPARVGGLHVFGVRSWYSAGPLRWDLALVSTKEIFEMFRCFVAMLRDRPRSAQIVLKGCNRVPNCQCDGSAASDIPCLGAMIMRIVYYQYQVVGDDRCPDTKRIADSDGGNPAPCIAVACSRRGQKQ